MNCFVIHLSILCFIFRWIIVYSVIRVNSTRETVELSSRHTKFSPSGSRSLGVGAFIFFPPYIQFWIILIFTRIFWLNICPSCLWIIRQKSLFWEVYFFFWKFYLAIVIISIIFVISYLLSRIEFLFVFRNLNNLISSTICRFLFLFCFFAFRSNN